MSTLHNRMPIAAAAVVSIAALLAACDRTPDNTTAGEKVDAAVANTEQKMDEAAAAAKDAGAQVKEAASEAADSVADSAQDATITAEVKTELAKDNDLSALAINVDTNNRRVSLSGSAPSDSARQKATTVAANVKGVSSVENKLVVEPPKS